MLVPNLLMAKALMIDIIYFRDFIGESDILGTKLMFYSY